MNDRLDLKVDIFDAKAQPAQAVPELTEQELISAILQEFGDDFDFLGADPTAYRLLRADDESPLEAETPIGSQLKQRAHLVLTDLERPMPAGATAATDQIYLRDQAGGNVYRLNWLPAIIGRPDQNRAENELLAVNLESYATGLRVSRRHARIVADERRYWIEGTASNPTLLQKPDELEPVDATTERQPLDNGDIIKLSRSGIDLRFIVRHAHQ